MKDNMISIIVPVYNREKYISRCVESLLRQTYTNIEVILVDDGSTDNSMKVMKKLQKKDERLKIISQRNSGVSSARNLGLLQAKGEFIQFVDSDDYIEPQMCFEMINALKTTLADIAICGYNKVNQEQNISVKGIDRYVCNFKEIEKELPYLFQNAFLNYPWNKLYRRDVLTSLFDLNLAVGEDLIFNLDNFQNAKSIILLEDCFYNYVEEADNSLTKNYKEDTIKREVYLFKRVNEFCEDNLIDKKYMNETVNTLINVIQHAIYTSQLNYREKNIVVKEWVNNKTIQRVIHQYEPKILQDKVIKIGIVRQSVAIIVWFFVLKKGIKKVLKAC